ncbi:MAG: Radical domain protein [Massilia sp.]|nr:Radical domain protein [Massilia sp.]
MTGQISEGRILLVHMPVANHFLPSLAIEKLAEILRDAGSYVETLYGTLKFAPQLPFWLHHSGIAPAVFGSIYYDEADTDWVTKIVSIIAPSFASEETSNLNSIVARGIDSARRCVERCMRHAASGNFTSVGISIAFDAQRLPSAALAKEIKSKFPKLKIIAGGTACDGEMGPALMQVFPEFDAVLSGEADNSIVEIFNALHGNQQCIVPGLSWRNLNQDQPFPKSSSRIAVPSLDNSLIPNYSDYFLQASKSEYSSEIESNKVVLLEGSRGCWYGHKNHCTFCGIRAVKDPYRTVPTDQLLSTIDHLQGMWEPSLIYFTDAILSRDAFRNLLPKLQQKIRDRSVRTDFFAESKSNLSPSEVRALSFANVRRIQPGIETFLTSTLLKMKKGATGVQQIELLKWCAAYQILPIYGLLLGTPGETRDDQYELADICAVLHHLPPPVGVNKLQVHRFSPMFEHPDSSGIKKIFPFPYQRLLYRYNDELLMKLCYEFDYAVEPAIDSSEIESFRAVVDEVAEWQACNHSVRKIYFASSSGAVVVDEKDGKCTMRNYSGVHSMILARSMRAISLRNLIEDQDTYTQDEIEGAIELLCDQGALIKLDQRILNIAVPALPDQYVKEAMQIEIFTIKA